MLGLCVEKADSQSLVHRLSGESIALPWELLHSAEPINSNLSLVFCSKLSHVFNDNSPPQVMIPE